MKILIPAVLISIGVCLWWFQAGVALRQCRLNYVDEVTTNQYDDVFTSGLSQEKRAELDEYTLDSVPECEEQIAKEYYVPKIGMKITKIFVK